MDREERLRQFEEWFGRIHALPEAYVSTEGESQHRDVGRQLFEASVGFLERLPLSGEPVVLDIGMGYGHHCRWFAGKGCRTTGITTHLTDALRSHAEENGYECLPMDMHHLDGIADQSIDLVWSHHSLEHSYSPLLALREWYRVLKPGGYIAVTVPPHNGTVASGHFTMGWTVGQLLYLLAVAGFDVSDGYFIEEGYNVRGLASLPRTPSSEEGASWLHILKDRLPELVQAHMLDAPRSLGRYQLNGEIRHLSGDSISFKPRGISRILARLGIGSR